MTLTLTPTGRGFGLTDLYALYPFLPAGSVDQSAGTITANLTSDQINSLVADGIANKPSGINLFLIAGALAALAFFFR